MFRRLLHVRDYSAFLRQSRYAEHAIRGARFRRRRHAERPMHPRKVMRTNMAVITAQEPAQYPGRALTAAFRFTRTSSRCQPTRATPVGV